jgi:hypothetical protein
LIPLAGTAVADRAPAAAALWLATPVTPAPVVLAPPLASAIPDSGVAPSVPADLGSPDAAASWDSRLAAPAQDWRAISVRASAA